MICIYEYIYYKVYYWKQMLSRTSISEAYTRSGCVICHQQVTSRDYVHCKKCKYRCHLKCCQVMKPERDVKHVCYKCFSKDVLYYVMDVYPYYLKM